MISRRRCCCVDDPDVVESNCPACTFADVFDDVESGWNGGLGSDHWYLTSGRLQVRLDGESTPYPEFSVSNPSPIYTRSAISITPESGKIWHVCVEASCYQVSTRTATVGVQFMVPSSGGGRFSILGRPAFAAASQDYVVFTKTVQTFIEPDIAAAEWSSGIRLKVEMRGITSTTATMVDYYANGILLHREFNVALGVSINSIAPGVYGSYISGSDGDAYAEFDDFCFYEGFVGAGSVLDLPSDANWTETDGDTARTTGEATDNSTGYVSGDYLELTENSGAGQLSRANIPLSDGDWKVWIRYVYDNGSATADATVEVTGEDSVTLAMRTGNVAGTDGNFSRNTVLYGFVDAGDITISTAGSKTIVVTGPSSTGDALIFDHIILEAL